MKHKLSKLLIAGMCAMLALPAVGTVLPEVVPVVYADETASVVASGSFKSGGTWSLDSEGTLTLSGDISSDITDPSSGSWPWYSYRSKVKAIAVNDARFSGSLKGIFAYHKNLKTADLTGADTSNVTSISSMFSDCSSLTDIIGMNELNVSNLSDIAYAFYGCNSLTSVDLSKWEFSQKLTMSSMFRGCDQLEYLGLPTTDSAKVTFGDALYGCVSVRSGKFGNNGTWTLSEDGSLTLSGDIKNIVDATSPTMWPWHYLRKDVKKVVIASKTSVYGSVAYAFSGMVNLASIDGLDNLDVSLATSTESMFYYCSSIDDLSGVKNWNVSAIDSANSMFAYCQNASKKSNSSDLISAWNLSSSCDTTNMFQGWTTSQTLKLSKLKVALENTSEFELDENGNYTYTPKSLSEGYLQPTYSVNFSLSGEEEHEKGSIELRIPANLFKNRVGSYTYMNIYRYDGIEHSYSKYPSYSYHSFSVGERMTHVNFSIPVAPNTSDSLPFNYSYDSNTDEYVVTNTETLPAATEVAFTFPYTSCWNTWVMKNGAKTDEFYANLVVKDAKDNVISKKETAPGIIPYTAAQYTNGGISVVSSSLSYPSRWSDKYKLADGDYLYVVYASHMYKEATQLWEEAVTATAGNGGIILAYAQADWSYTSSILTSSQNTASAMLDPENDFAQILVAYPLTDDMKDGKYHNLTITTSHTLNGLDDASDERELHGHYSYLYNSFKAPSNYGSVSKYVEQSSDLQNRGNLYTSVKQDYGMLSAISKGLDAFQQNTVFLTKFYSMTYASTIIDNATDAADPTNYGINPVTTSYIDDMMFLDGDYTHKLSSQDYEISYAKIFDIYYYEYSESTNGWTVHYLQNSDERPDIYIYAKKDDGPWEKIGLLSETTLYSYSTGSLLKDKGYTGIKFETTNTLCRIEFILGVRITLKPSEYVMSKINDKSITEHSVTNYSTLVSYDHNGNIILGKGSYTGEGADTIAEHDKSDYGATMYHGKAKIILEPVKENVDFEKKYYSISTDTKKQRFAVTYHVNISDQADLPNVSEDIIKDLYLLKGTFYDLLPLGSTLNKDTIKISNADNFEVKTIDNYNNTGRTLLIAQIKDDKKHNITSSSSVTWVSYSYSLSYTVYYSFDSMQDFGSTLHNSTVFMYDGNSWLEEGTVTSLGTGEKGDSEIDLTSILGDKAKEKLFVSDDIDIKLTVGSAADLSLSKAVKDTDNTVYSQGHTGDVVVSNGESYSYRLRFGSESDTTTSNIILFDSIENYVLEDGTTSGWRGTLESIDLTQPKLKGIAPVVYYSTVAGLDIDKHHDIADTTVWTKMEDDTDLSKVTAIAIDMRKDKDGNDYKLPEKETIRVTLNMKAPTGDTYTVAAKKKLRTYNNVFLLNDLTTSTDYQSNHFIHYDYTEVALEKIAPDPVLVSLSATKVLQDAGGESGRGLAENEFSFDLTSLDGTVLQTKSNDAKGLVTFDAIEFKEVGTYNYVMSEVLPEDGTPSEDETSFVKDQVSYDLTKKTFTIEVTQNKDGNLTATSSTSADTQ